MAVYKLRWNIRLARSSYGMMLQLLAGLITYLLLAIYCHEEYKESVSIKRVRQLRNAIRTESRHPDFDPLKCMIWWPDSKLHSCAKT